MGELVDEDRELRRWRLTGSNDDLDLLREAIGSAEIVGVVERDAEAFDEPDEALRLGARIAGVSPSSGRGFPSV